MTTFLFWNINRRPLTEQIVRLINRHTVDVVILAECEASAENLLLLLNARLDTPFESALSLCEAIRVLTRFPSRFCQPVFDSDVTGRYAMHRLTIPSQHDILLVSAHLPSKLHFSDDSQILEAVALSRAIRDVEKRIGHSRTVLTGDLNMNPFEVGIVGTQGLHSVMTRGLASRGRRMVQRKEYPYFYNPMWGHFGDRTETPAGTYYQERPEGVCYFWNLFDQVMIRPELLPVWDANSPEILTGDGIDSFLTSRGTPARNRFSDHLPLLFRLNLHRVEG